MWSGAACAGAPWPATARRPDLGAVQAEAAKSAALQQAAGQQRPRAARLGAQARDIDAQRSEDGCCTCVRELGLRGRTAHERCGLVLAGWLYKPRGLLLASMTELGALLTAPVDAMWWCV